MRLIFLGFVIVYLSRPALADIPIWYTGTCGVSPYPDAGERCRYNETCVEPSVFGGIRAWQGEFPHTASIRRISDGLHVCSGAIINEEWVATTAKCTIQDFIGDITNLQVVVGGLLLDTVASNEQIFNMAALLVHEEFDTSFDLPANNDIALIKVDGLIDLSSSDVTPICACDDALVYSGMEVYFAGWGASTLPVTGPTNELLFTSMVVYTSDYCQNQYDGVTGVTITERMICAGGEGTQSGKGICEGDRGGPLFIKDNGIFRLVGLATYDRFCGDLYPGVFTNIGHPLIQDWIMSKLDKN